MEFCITFAQAKTHIDEFIAYMQSQGYKKSTQRVAVRNVEFFLNSVEDKQQQMTEESIYGFVDQRYDKVYQHSRYILLCRDIELACDEKVIRSLGKEESVAYSEALLSCSVSRRTILVCPLAFGEVGVKERVKRVLNYKKPAFWIVVVAALTSVVLAVCFLTNPHSFPVDLASIQISEASTLDLRTSSGPTIHQLSAAETEELSSRLKDLIIRQKDQDFQGQTPFYSLYVDTMEQGRITFSAFDHDGTNIAVLYDNVYYRITNSDFARYLQNICAGGSRSAAASSPFGRSYHVQEIAYSDLVYNFGFTLETAPLYELTGDQGLLICENKNDMAWLNAGTFREITLGENFTACFRDLDGMGWNGMDADTLAEENQQAWQLAVADQTENTVIYNLLLQKNGDIYLAYGYGSASGSGDIELNSVRWVFYLAEGLSSASASNNHMEVIDASLDAAIQTALADHYVPDKPDGLIHIESYNILFQQELCGVPKAGQDQYAKSVTVYLLVLHESFRPDSDPTQPIEGVGGDYIPTALTFRLSDGKYFLEEYWEPRDGGYYTDDIKAKFPEVAEQQVWNDQEIIRELQQSNQDQIYRMLQEQGSFEELADRLLETICRSSNFSADPNVYIHSAQEQYDELLGYGEAALRYCFRRFLEGGQTGLDGYIMAQLCQDIMEAQFGMPQVDMLYETGQDWFDAFYANSQEVAENVSLEDLEKYHPVSKILLDMTGEDQAEEAIFPGNVTHTYKYAGKEPLEGAAVILYDDGKFQMQFSLLSSYIGVGQYVTEDNRLILKTEDGEFTYVFDLIEDGLRFNASSSSTMVWFSGLEEGSILQETE